jgi:hypothetical protein
MSAVTNPSISRLRHNEAYCVRTLADPRTAEHRKPKIIAALDQLRAELANRCTDCGLPLSLPTSLARQKGDTCYHKNGA